MREVVPLGYKFVLIVNIPHGAEMVIGVIDGCFALVPIVGGVIRYAIAWDNKSDIRGWVRNFKEDYGSGIWEPIAKLKPKIKMIRISQ